MKRVSVSHRILLLFTAGIVTGLIIQTFTLLLGSLQYTKTLNSSRSFLKKKNVVINYWISAVYNFFATYSQILFYKTKR